MVEGERKRLLRRVLAAKLFGAIMLLSLVRGAQAQGVLVDIGFNDIETGFTTITFSGINANVQTENVFGAYSNGTDPLGQSGNALIITPISDPVIEFNNYHVENRTASILRSMTFRMPQYLSGPDRTRLGFIKTVDTFGIGSNSANFEVEFSDFIGIYDGDALTFHGSEVYSTLHFFQGAGAAQINAAQVNTSPTGVFHFYAGYPAAQGGLTQFFTDIVPDSTNISSTPNTGGYRFNPLGNPSGGIVSLSVAPEPGSLVLGTLGLLGLPVVLRRRR